MPFSPLSSSQFIKRVSRASSISWRRTALVAVALCWLSSLWTSSAAFAAGELELRYWAPDVTSTVGLDDDFDSGDLPGGIILGTIFQPNLEADESLEARFTLRAGWGLFGRIAYQEIESSGGTDIDIFNDLPIDFPIIIDLDLDIALSSRLDFEYARFALGWQFSGPSERLRIGPFVEAKGVRGDTSLSTSFLGMGASFDEDFEAGLLSAGGMLNLRPTDKLEIFAEASFAVDQDEADLTDIEIGARYYFTDTLGIGGGYRTLTIDGVIDGVVLDFEFDGAFASAALRF